MNQSSNTLKRSFELSLLKSFLKIYLGITIEFGAILSKLSNPKGK